MLIVNTETKVYKTIHYGQVPEGWLEIPVRLEPRARAYCPYCELVIEDDVLMDIMPTERPAPDLEPIKAERIAKSKADLETYLLNHPIKWSDGEYYSITSDKSSRLADKIKLATLSQDLSKPYTLKWNSTGEVNKEWSLEELSDLAFAIDQRVDSLVTYQQEQEVLIRNAKTLEELNYIVIDYDSVLYLEVE